MSIDRKLLTQAINSVSMDDLLEIFGELGELGHHMVGSNPDDPLNQALERIFNHPGFAEKVEHYAKRGGASIENTMFPLMVGLIVGLLTPVTIDQETV